ncbi:MAG: GxxExxY protein [Pirellulales bacterium]|nr:GxxExxY protein [Pirellulales bacterium]
MQGPISDSIEKIGREVVDAAIRVHQALGPGLLEAVYESCLFHELSARGIKCVRQVPITVTYRDLQIDAGLRLDMLVQDVVIVELKAVEQMIPLFEAQLVTYLKLTGLRLGYLINFNTVLLKQGLKRMVL